VPITFQGSLIPESRSYERCPAARDYSRAYLHHLVKSGELLGSMLLSWANVAFYQQLMAAMRVAIAEGRFAAWAAETKTRLGGAGSAPGSDP
jgi:queuine tRNA-ribosyltransferase